MEENASADGGARHPLFTPTYTGLGERAHLANADIDLDCHIADILGVLEFGDLRAVHVIGHSYGGMVATGVADRAGARRQAVDGWKILPGPMPPDMPADDVAWSTPRRMPQPAKTFEQKLKLHNGPLTRHYIYCARRPPDDRFRRFYERTKRKGGAPTRSTPATMRTSLVPRRWRICSIASRARSCGCHRPGAAAPAAGAAGTTDRPARNAFGFAAGGAGSPSSAICRASSPGMRRPM